MDSIYWVISRDCNQRCAHCYNNSGPGGVGLTAADVTRCVAQLPAASDVGVGRVILSGGEVLVWPELLFHTLSELRRKYDDTTELWIQTNGDLLDETMLERLLEAGVGRIDVSSIDDFHPVSTVDRRDELTAMFQAHGMRPADDEPPGQSSPSRFAFWGATEDVWIGPLWPRGRARLNGLSAAAPEHRFCEKWSGAKNFLNYRGLGCEVNIQLADVYPCCPMTCRPIGNLLRTPLIDILDRCATHPAYQALNEGRPDRLGEWMGLSSEFGEQRTRELGNECLWCDEFFTRYAPDLLELSCATERGLVDLQIAPQESHRRRPTIESHSDVLGGKPASPSHVSASIAACSTTRSDRS